MFQTDKGSSVFFHALEIAHKHFAMFLKFLMPLRRDVKAIDKPNRFHKPQSSSRR